MINFMEKMESDAVSPKKAKQEYNEIADQYQEATKRKLRECTYDFSWVKLLGDLSGKKVLDLACGEGVSSRLARNLGATEVVGVDISEKLISKAVEEEKKINSIKPIKYIVGDITSIPVKGKFDVITGAMALNYSKSEEMMKGIIMGAKDCLKNDGIFHASIPNPERMKGSDSYGAKMTPDSEKEGSEVKIELSDFTGKKICEFTNYYWTKKTYESIFKEAGFETEWINSEISPEGKKELGEDFWKEYEKNPVYIMIKAKLKTQDA